MCESAGPPTTPGTPQALSRGPSKCRKLHDIPTTRVEHSERSDPARGSVACSLRHGYEAYTHSPISCAQQLKSSCRQYPRAQHDTTATAGPQAESMSAVKGGGRLAECSTAPARQTPCRACNNPALHRTRACGFVETEPLADQADQATKEKHTMPAVSSTHVRCISLCCAPMLPEEAVSCIRGNSPLCLQFGAPASRSKPRSSRCSCHADVHGEPTTKQ